MTSEEDDWRESADVLGRRDDEREKILGRSRDVRERSSRSRSSVSTSRTLGWCHMVTPCVGGAVPLDAIEWLCSIALTLE